jgi:hypothetical protein
MIKIDKITKINSCSSDIKILIKHNPLSLLKFGTSKKAAKFLSDCIICIYNRNAEAYPWAIFKLDKFLSITIIMKIVKILKYSSNF